MTAESNNPNVRELLAERFGEELVPLEPAPADDARRVRFISALHALIAFFTEHPEIPAPWAIVFHVKVPDVAALEQLAAHAGWSSVYGRQPQAAIDIFREPLWANVIAAVQTEDRPL